MEENERKKWKICPECLGLGKKKRRVRKSVRLRYISALETYEKSGKQGKPPVLPIPHVYSCPECSGSGLISSEEFPIPDFEKFPHVSIIGGGIGGVALAVACLHRGIPFTLFERDLSFDSRSQGYGLTLQQASKAIEGFGVFTLKKSVVSTRHLVHQPDGKVVGEWGMRKWLENGTQKSTRKTNVHIARQALRAALLEQLDDENNIVWNHRLLNIKKNEDGKLELQFQNGEILKTIHTDLVVGADGIRSTVRNLVANEEKFPLRYLNCLVILGICPLNSLKNRESDLLDSATVFQTANGHERIYMMPYDSETVMWQLSFPMEEEEAKILSAKGSVALKEEAIRRTPWHSPIPEILSATPEVFVSGYPVYDRELLTSEFLENAGNITLIGDAAHPMSPFKGQGANQALLDALSLAREIFKNCNSTSDWRKSGIRETVLTKFESEMLERSSIKVADSAAAAEFLHSEIALYEGNEPRGRVLKRKKDHGN
ncbi:FAD-dependent oxidoreductase [Kaistella montana]|uniref:FAD-dependent oxidoreductase n=1 Tax=Kaistella montana TaxID=1849733 RepID=A0ABW5KA03_9FLAO|nr:NAD(P)/FAD-dependent oxidoreductase [Kaistella montana]MCQ4035312.1 FAD-dependent monooxygenase [Kaistella montana]